MSLDWSDYPGVPDDFPITPTVSALAGAAPKLSLVEEGGRYYSIGTSPSEVRAALSVCEDLVEQLTSYCQRKLSKFHGDRDATLEAVHQSLLGKGWCSEPQSAWIVRNIRLRLGWPAHST
ncbi:hypothetical protein [Acidovorax soli]|uniref:hypothetical protein n=1 Tax=Acidovorax soli TaxID=592050 RepID=UPI0021AAB612|nr:hypothetical protein [Acidovorax soli]